MKDQRQNHRREVLSELDNVAPTNLGEELRHQEKNPERRKANQHDNQSHKDPIEVLKK